MGAQLAFGLVDGFGPPSELIVEDPALIVAGYTGRDESVLRAHIDELAAHGIPRPEKTPAFYPLPASLLRMAPAQATVSTAETSGEAEPVLVRTAEGRLLLGVGSDHTDRAAERLSVAASKAACPKFLGAHLWPFDAVSGRWSELELQSTVGDEGALYQEGRLSVLLHPAVVLAEALKEHPEPDDRALVLFLGTVPLLAGEIRHDRRFTARLRDGSRELTCEYEVVPEGSFRRQTQPATPY